MPAFNFNYLSRNLGKKKTKKKQRKTEAPKLDLLRHRSGIRV
jgi:hypothetical protein